MCKFYLLICFACVWSLSAPAQTSIFLPHKNDSINPIIPAYLQQIIPFYLDTVRYTPAPHINSKIDAAQIAKRTFHWILYYDVYTTLTAIKNFNSNNSNDINNVYFYYNMDIKNNIEYRKLKWDTYLFNDYGVRHFFDSTTLKTQDQFNFKNSVYYPFYKKKLYISLTANTQTKLWNTHRYRNTMSGANERFLYDGFMSPGTIFYAGGITYEGPQNATINLGLGSSKVTKIRNQKIFESREVESINGLDKGQRKKAEFGATLTTTVPMQHLNKYFHWEFYGNMFAPLNHLRDIHYYSIDANNALHIILLKYVRLTLRSKISFNSSLNPKPVILNQLSLGFYLNNHL